MKSITKPFKRGRMRLFAGQVCHTAKRYGRWAFGGIAFAKIDNFPAGQHVHFAHKTPLLRNLSAEEMALQRGKVNNLKIAAARINGIVIKPGQTFSFWRAIGRPTRKKGYRHGMVLSQGRIKSGIGGGLCQLSNMIYWMALHTELTITERHRHGYDVFADAGRTQPFASGATCFYNYGDLMIANSTGQAFLLRINVGEKYLEGAILAERAAEYYYEVYEKEHLIQSQFWGGYTRQNVIHRKKYIGGEICADEFISENHAIMMHNPLLAENKEKICNQL